MENKVIHYDRMSLLLESDSRYSCGKRWSILTRTSGRPAAILEKEQRFRQTDIPAAVLAILESGRIAVEQRQGGDVEHFQAESNVGVQVA